LFQAVERVGILKVKQQNFSQYICCQCVRVKSYGKKQIKSSLIQNL